MNFFKQMRQSSTYYEFRTLIQKALEEVPKWSTLRTLGQSRLLAFTSFVPFLGVLIIFNHQIVDFLQISPTLVAKWNSAPGTADINNSKSFTLSRLEIAYFGLCFIGISSFLFAIICPPDVKVSADISAYIESEKSLITNARTSLLVYYVARDFLLNHGDEEASGPKFLREMAYTLEQIALFDNTFKEIAEDADPPDDASQQVSAIGESSPVEHAEPYVDPVFEMGLLNISGEYLTEKVARIVYNQRRVEKFFWADFGVTARRYTIDLLTLRYLAVDRSRPLARLIITACYIFGFVILLCPTAWTFVRILVLVLTK